MLKKLTEFFTSPTFLHVLFISLCLILQLGCLLFILIKFSEYFIYFYIVNMILGLVLSLHVVNSLSNPAYKIAWIIVILFLPMFGSLLYILLGNLHMGRKTRRKLRRNERKIYLALDKNEDILKAVAETDLSAASQLRYVMKNAGCPPYRNTRVDFLSPGEVKFERLKNELRKAESFIFMEYFIIGSGQMWDEILEILLQKKAEGVEVRVIYDDFGSLVTLPYRYDRTLNKMGIPCKVFNRLVPFLNGALNNRDHRKIVVIDGKVGFTGGINIADEYINAIDKLGHWKDSAVVLEGEAVWSLTVIFLSTWNYINNLDEDFSQYRVWKHEPLPPEECGIVQPYYDSPLDKEQVGETVYLNMVTRAKRYVYISSPYLILDNEMTSALCNAAKSGIDVRIVTPHQGDHWYVHAVTRSNYRLLTESGVRIYEYTPGFIHAKVFVCDDEFATVGTINMDYRSLYLHFECGALLYRCPAVIDIYEDYLGVLRASSEITASECRRVPMARRLGRAILRVFAPLM